MSSGAGKIADGLSEILDGGVVSPPGPGCRYDAARVIVVAAHRLNVLRENWKNPHEWVYLVPEIVRGYPDRIIPKPEYATEIKKRTLTNLYKERPTWSDMARKTLDAPVAAAYSWTDHTPDMPEHKILRRLPALNLERAGAQG